MDGSFLTFLGVSLLVIVAPGPDTALTLRNSVRGGRLGGIGTALGVSMTLAWLAAYAVVIATAGRLLRISRLERSIHAVSGLVLVGLGARAAIDAR